MLSDKLYEDMVKANKNGTLKIRIDMYPDTETYWAIKNLELAGLFDKDSDYDGMLGEAVKRLLLCHQKERHSGFSHRLAVELFHAVALGKALTLEFWELKYKAYNEMALANGMNRWTEDEFEKQVMKKPEIDAKSKGLTEETKEEVRPAVQETPDGVRGTVEDSSDAT